MVVVMANRAELMIRGRHGLVLAALACSCFFVSRSVATGGIADPVGLVLAVAVSTTALALTYLALHSVLSSRSSSLATHGIAAFSGTMLAAAGFVAVANLHAADLGKVLVPALATGAAATFFAWVQTIGAEDR